MARMYIEVSRDSPDVDMIACQPHAWDKLDSYEIALVEVRCERCRHYAPSWCWLHKDYHGFDWGCRDFGRREEEVPDGA